MAARELHLETLLGKQVMDVTGQPIGRIEEVRAQQQDQEWVIQEYWVGSAAVLERLSAWTLGLGLLRLLRARKLPNGYRIPWDQLDLSNPDRPRLKCTLQALTAVDQPAEAARE